MRVETVQIVSSASTDYEVKDEVKVRVLVEEDRAARTFAWAQDVSRAIRQARQTKGKWVSKPVFGGSKYCEAQESATIDVTRNETRA